MQRPRILIIYTGGTIGMIQDVGSGTLVPFTLEAMLQKIPSIRDLGIELHSTELHPVIDSSNVNPEVWVQLAELIGKHYADFDGFVILHGSDTMAYTASALSFMFDGLAKPVILTGSQLPIGLVRTDARENLITSLSIAAMQHDGEPIVNEVCIYFEDRLFRGNRTHKFNAENFDAFRSVNYPALADAGVHIRLHIEHLLPRPTKDFQVHFQLEKNIAIVPLFPGIDMQLYTDMLITNGVEGLIVQTYGSGNGPSDERFVSALRRLHEHGVLLLNITQCRGGAVEMEKYATGRALKDAGMLSGKDMTLEAAVTKMMHVFGVCSQLKHREEMMLCPLRGEMSL
jgi:L-asparaginase